MDWSALLAMIPTQYIPYVTAGVMICAALSVVLPVPAATSTSAYASVYRLMQFVAFNFGKATNKAPTQ